MKNACQHIALPRPGEVLLRPVSEVEGVWHAREFPVLAKKRDGGSQSHTHAAIVFKERKAGPVQVGAGRFQVRDYAGRWIGDDCTYRPSKRPERIVRESSALA